MLRIALGSLALVLCFTIVGGAQEPTAIPASSAPVTFRMQVVQVSLTDLHAAERNPNDKEIECARTVFPDGSSAGTSVNIRVADQYAVFNAIKRLESENKLKITTDPTRCSTGSKPINFYYGGNLPFPVTRPDGSIEEQYLRYGAEAALVVSPIDDRRLLVEVRPDFNDVHPTRVMTMNGITVPDMRSTELRDGVEVESGQTVVIPGISQFRAQSERPNTVRRVEAQIFFLFTFGPLSATETAATKGPTITR